MICHTLPETGEDGNAIFGQLGRFSRAAFSAGVSASPGAQRALRIEACAADAECVDGFALLFEKPQVLAEVEPRFFDAQWMTAIGKSGAHLHQLVAAHRIEPDLVEEPQQPLFAIAEFGGLPVTIPHLHGAPDELVAAGSLHAVHA